MELILSATFVFLVWVGVMLTQALLREIDRQNNPQPFFPNRYRSGSRRAINSGIQTVYRNYKHEQLEKPHRSNLVPIDAFRTTQAQHNQNTNATKWEPQICVRYQTQDRLYKLVNGDMKVVRRLLDGARERNPERSNQWIWEKVIYDLERDRRI